MEEKDRIDLLRGKLTPEDTKMRLRMSGSAGFGIYKPLEDRIKLVMNNLASNTDIYGIDQSVLKANERIDVNTNTDV